MKALIFLIIPFFAFAQSESFPGAVKDSLSDHWVQIQKNIDSLAAQRVRINTNRYVNPSQISLFTECLETAETDHILHASLDNLDYTYATDLGYFGLYKFTTNAVSLGTVTPTFHLFNGWHNNNHLIEIYAKISDSGEGYAAFGIFSDPSFTPNDGIFFYTESGSDFWKVRYRINNTNVYSATTNVEHNDGEYHKLSIIIRNNAPPNDTDEGVIYFYIDGITKGSYSGDMYGESMKPFIVLQPDNDLNPSLTMDYFYLNVGTNSGNR